MQMEILRGFRYQRFCYVAWKLKCKISYYLANAVSPTQPRVVESTLASAKMSGKERNEEEGRVEMLVFMFQLEYLNGNTSDLSRSTIGSSSRHRSGLYESGSSSHGGRKHEKN